MGTRVCRFNPFIMLCRQILCRASRLPGPVSDLIRNHGLMQWVSAQLAAAAPHQPRHLQQLSQLADLLELGWSVLGDEQRGRMRVDFVSALESLTRAAMAAGETEATNRALRMSAGVKGLDRTPRKCSLP